MLHLTKLNQENLWKIVKKIRLSFLSQHENPECQNSGTLLSNSIIRDNINSLATELQLITTTSTSNDVSHKILQTAGAMFTYLNFCPPKLFLFINELKTRTPKEIILALTSVIKTIDNADEKKITIEVLLGLMDSLNLTEFEKILLSTGHCFTNAILGNCTKNINMSCKDIQGFSKLQSLLSHIQLIGFKKLQKFTNHPVHIKEDYELYPTALIPFCEFGGNMSVMGVKIDQFDVPVCNSFRPKIIHAIHPCKSSMPVIYAIHPCQSSMPVVTPPPPL